jgi:single-stranded DNA-binding protein
MGVFVLGKLVQRTWQDDGGNKRHSVELQVSHVGPDLQSATAEVAKSAQRAPRPLRRPSGNPSHPARPEPGFGGAPGALSRLASHGGDDLLLVEVVDDPVTMPPTRRISLFS